MSKDQFHDDVLTEYTKRFVGVNDDRPVDRPQVADFLGQLGLARERPATRYHASSGNPGDAMAPQQERRRGRKRREVAATAAGGGAARPRGAEALARISMPESRV